MSIKDKLSNPLTGLAIVISFSLIAIFTMAILVELKKNKIKSEALVAEVTTPEAVKTTLKNGESSESDEKTGKPKKKPRKMCDSPECITLSYQLLNWRDPNIDPCDDFYKSTCGRYIKHSDTRGSRIVEKDAITLRLISEFLHKNEPTESKSEKTMKLYYQKCLELSEKEKDEFKEIQKNWYKELFEDIGKIGFWPSAQKSWNESKFDLNEFLSNMAKMHIRDFGIFEFETDESKTLNLLTPGSLRWNRKILEGILEANGINSDSKKLSKDLKGVEDFLSALQKMKNSDSESESESESFETLTSKVPSIDFERIIKSLLPPTEKGKQMEEKLRKKIRIRDSELLKDDNLEKILKTTSKRTLANFLILKFIQESTLDIPSDFRSAKTLDCGKIVIHHFPRAAVRIMVRNYFEKENLKIVSEMVDDVKKTYIQMIENSTWITEDSKKALTQKMENMKKMIGYPEDYEPEGTLDRIFEALDVSEQDSYYTLIQKMLRFKTDQTMEYIAEDLSLDPEHPLFQTNAFHSKSQNSLSVMVSMIDDPLFDATYPKYAKIASTGSIISQVMGGSIDFESSEDQEKLKKKGQCLVKQYGQYDDPVFGKGLNGTSLRNQLTSDAYGAQATWNIFKNINFSEETIIPGFKEDEEDKLFFQMYALNFCAPQNRNRKSAETVPTNSFRVNGVFSNMKQFAETFDCPVGSLMNPESRCELL